MIAPLFIWNAQEHSDDGNVRWAWLRAVEWINWPSFISQPICPILLYFYNWPEVVGQRMISARLVDIGPIFTKLAFITCPIAAFLIWQQHDYLKAGIALLWPLVINLIDLLVSPIEVLLRRFDNSALDIGPVQKRLLQAIGYVKTETAKTEPAATQRTKQ